MGVKINRGGGGGGGGVLLLVATRGVSLDRVQGEEAGVARVSFPHHIWRSRGSEGEENENNQDLKVQKQKSNKLEV